MIKTQNVTDVIFVAEAISYGDMVFVMNQCAGNTVAFRLIPGMAENIVGKSGIIQLEELPVVALELKK